MNIYFLKTINQYYLTNPTASSPGKLWFALCANFPAEKPVPYIFFRRSFTDQQIINQIVAYQDSNVETDRHAFIIQLIKNAFVNKTLNPNGLLVEMIQVFTAIHPDYFKNINNMVAPYLIEPSIQEARSIFKLICSQDSTLAEHADYIKNNICDLLINLNVNEKTKLLDILYGVILSQEEVGNKPYESFAHYFSALPQKIAVMYFRKIFNLTHEPFTEKLRKINLIIKCLPNANKELKDEIYQKLLEILDVKTPAEVKIVAQSMYDSFLDLKLTGKFWNTLKIKIIEILQYNGESRQSILICALIGKIAPRIHSASLKKLLLRIFSHNSIGYDIKIMVAGEVVFLIPSNLNQHHFDMLFDAEIERVFRMVSNSSSESFFAYFKNFRNETLLVSALKTDLSWVKAMLISLNKLSAIITEKNRIAWIRKQIKSAREGMQANPLSTTPRLALSSVAYFKEIIPPSYRIKVISRIIPLLANANRLNVTVALQTLNELFSDSLFLELATPDQLQQFVNTMLDELNIPFIKKQSEEFFKKFIKTVSQCDEALMEHTFAFFMEQGLATLKYIFIHEAFEILKSISLAKRKTLLAEAYANLIADNTPRASTFFGFIIADAKLVEECFSEDYLSLMKDFIIKGYESLINDWENALCFKIISETTNSIPLSFQQPIITLLTRQIFENDTNAIYYSVLALSKLAKTIPVTTRHLIISRVKGMQGGDFIEQCAFPLLTNLALEMDNYARADQIIDYLDILVTHRVHNEAIQSHVILLLKRLPEPRLNYFIYGYIPDLIAKSADSLLRLELMVIINKINISRSKNMQVSNQLDNIREIAGLVFDYANEDHIVRLSR